MSNSSPSDSIDFVKLRSVFRRNWLWVVAIILATNSAGYLYIRYTKPLYESRSELKLDIKSQASSLGLTQFQDNTNFDNLSGEIELINSRLFFNKVVETISFDVQYFTYGNILDDEKYKHSPFHVEYDLHSASLYNTPVNVELLNDSDFILEYRQGQIPTTIRGKFGEALETDLFKFNVTLTQFFNDDLLDEKFYFIINSHEALISYLENNISVEPLNLSAHTIRISFQDHNKFKAHDLVNAIDTLYLRYTHLQKNQANENKIKYLNEQMDETEKILEKFESYFENFTIDNKTVDLDHDMKKTLDYINRLDSQRFELRARLRHIEDISEKIITEDLEDINVKRNYIPDYMIKELEAFDELHFELKQLSLAYNEKTYAFQRKTQELDMVKGNLVTDLNQYKLNLYEGLNELNNKKRELEANLVKLPSKGTEYNKAKRYYALYEEMYLSLMKSKNEFGIARAGTVPDFKILAAATLPGTPVSPNKLLVYGAGVISGVIFSFLYMAFIYLTSNKITSVNEVEMLTKAPILGTLPYEGEASEKLRMLVKAKPKSATSEAFRAIRTNIEFMVPGFAKKVISVSSTVSGEGKTFVTLNLGGVIAMSNQKVVILDLDLRKPKIHRDFSTNSNNKGVSTILIRKHSIEDCIQETDLDNLDFIPAGPTPPNPSELLLNGEFDGMVQSLKKTYDVILLDTPPIGLVTDAIIAMKKSDLRLFVVRADYSQRSYLKAVDRLIDVNKFDHVAVIMNALKSSQGHGYGYGYGYGYGKHYYEHSSNGSWFHAIRSKLRV